MNCVIPFDRTRHANGSSREAAEPVDCLAQAPSLQTIAAPRVRQVLSVGREEPCALMPEPLHASAGISFCHVRDYRELWALSKAITCDAVLFHESLGHFELEEAARLVRRRWPSAKIVLIRSGGIALEDPLYDQRLKPPVDPDTLAAVLLGHVHLPGGKPRPRWRMAHPPGKVLGLPWCADGRGL